MTDDIAPEVALQKHLESTRPRVELHVQPWRVGIDGWAFFTTSVIGEYDAPDSIAVVREDGTVVEEEEERELGRIFHALGVREREPDETMLWQMTAAARALLADSISPVYAERIDSVASNYPDAEPTPPQVSWEDETLMLTYWGESGAQTPTLHKIEVRVGPEYDVEWTRERVASR